MKKILFYKKNILIIIVALVIAIGLIAISEAYILNGNLTKFSRGYILARPNDATGNVSYTLMEENQKQTDKHRIYLIGGSSLRAALVGDDYANDKLHEICGDDKTFVLLQANVATMIDMLEIVDNLPNENGTVVISSNVPKLLQYADTQSFLFKSKTAYDFKRNNELYNSLGYKAGLLDNFVSSNMVKKLFDRVFNAESFAEITMEFEVPAKVHKMPTYDKDFSNLASKYAGIFTRPNDTHFELYEILLEEILHICKAKGLNLVLIDTPLNIGIYSDDFIYGDDSALPKFRELNQSFSLKHDIAYLNFMQDLDIDKAHYKDLVHLKTLESRTLYTDTLIHELSLVVDQ